MAAVTIATRPKSRGERSRARTARPASWRAKRATWPTTTARAPCAARRARSGSTAVTAAPASGGPSEDVDVRRSDLGPLAPPELDAAEAAGRRASCHLVVGVPDVLPRERAGVGVHPRGAHLGAQQAARRALRHEDGTVEREGEQDGPGVVHLVERQDDEGRLVDRPRELVDGLPAQVEVDARVPG